VKWFRRQEKHGEAEELEAIEVDEAARAAEEATDEAAEIEPEVLEEADVEGVGFGFVFLRRTDSPTDLMAEDLMHGFSDPLGAEALAYFDRLAWLREHDVLEERFVLDPDTALERVYLPGDEG
jgi:hypothetical protein